MKELDLIDLQEIYRGGFEEGRQIGRQVGKSVIGALTVIGIWLLFI
ncbi:MAG: hypothetical protein VB075_06540 [Petrimonas sp.]|nr:hypothetical protein [Petrimonas sp.]MEA5044219.1 hypothetical protein [Petrimonas sp.]